MNHKDHEHDFNGWIQSTLLTRDGIRILAFEKYCLLCGLVEEPLPIGRIVK